MQHQKHDQLSNCDSHRPATKASDVRHEAINDWKSHLLRSVNQEQAKQTILSALTYDSILIIYLTTCRSRNESFTIRKLQYVSVVYSNINRGIFPSPVPRQYTLHRELIK